MRKTAFSSILSLLLAVLLIGLFTTNLHASIQINPASYNFNTVPIGGFATWPVTISNIGTTQLIVSSITIAGSGYSMDPNAGSPPCGTAPTLAAGNSCSISVKIAPVATGNLFGTLTVASDDPVIPLATANFSAEAIAPPAPVSVSGTITYSGGKTGRIYISLQGMNGNNLGTSIIWPTENTYTIRGVPPGSYTVNAFMDYLNLGTWVQTSPDGSTPANVSTTNVTGADIALTDPSPTAPPAPTGVSGSAGDAAVIIDWEKPRNNNIESADSYDIYWGTSLPLDKTNAIGSRLNFPAGSDSPAVIDGLANGSILYFIVIPKSGGVEGTASPPFGPLTIGAPTGGRSVSGTINYSGPAATGALYVAIVDPSNKGAGKVFFTKIPTPTATQNFTVSGIQDGSYEIFSIIDMNNDKIFGSGDVMDSRFSFPKIKLSGADLTGIIINLSAANADTTITTMHMKQGITTPIESYTVEAEIQGQRKFPVKVTLTSAPASMNLTPPIDIAISKEGRRFNFWQWSPTRPTVSDLYQFSITYADGTTDTAVTASVSGVNDYFPTNPLVSISNVPTFSWSAPTPAPSGYYSYNIWVNSTTGNFFWNSNDLPDSSTSIVYGANGSMAPPLTIGTQYNWQVGTRDLNGNMAAVGNDFTPTAPGAPLLFWSNPADIVFGTPLSALQLNANSTIPGTFANSPDFATVPAAGTVVLSVIFTPTDITNYTTATASVTLNILAAQAALVVTGLPSTAIYGQSGIVAASTGGSGTGALTYSAAGSTACSIDPSTGAVTITSGTGSCSISATKGADSNYAATTSTAVSITISKAPQALTFGTPPTLVYGGGTATVSASSSVPGFTALFSSLTPSVCTVSGATLTATGSGTCTIAADQAGDANYAPASQVTQSITVNIATFTITAATLNTNGTISPVGNTTLNYLASQVYTITPDTGYVIADVRVNGLSVGTNPVQTINNIATGHTIEVVFGPDGIIDPANISGVLQLGDVLLALTAAMGDVTLSPAQIKQVDASPVLVGVPQPDGKIDLGDVVVMLRRLVKLEKW